MDKLFKVGDEYHMMNDGDSNTTTVRDAVSFLALKLFDDVRELIKNEPDIQKRIPHEIMSLNAITNAAEFLSGIR